MREIKTQVKTFIIELECSCGGEIVETDKMIMTLPPKFIYTCRGCDDVKITTERYPKTVMERTGEGVELK